MMRGLGAERPRAVGVDPVTQAMHVQRVRHVVGVPHVDLQPLARPRVDHRSGDAVRVDGLVDVSGNELVGLWDQVAGVEIFAIDHRSQRARVDLGLRNQPVLVAVEAHAVAPVLNRRHHLVLRLDRAVVLDPLDLEIDVPLVTRRRLGMRRLDRDTDLRMLNVPQHRILGRGEELVVAVDLEVEIRPLVEEDRANAVSSKLMDE